jgi:hypothetical protein
MICNIFLLYFLKLYHISFPVITYLFKEKDINKTHVKKIIFSGLSYNNSIQKVFQ